ncbi:hypothetical protein Halha_1934 [Halobacteroides halobius DSM 5150]|uniref:Class IIb bacteriocin, lactobin A/cerein 7B family n=1 Tax=Halobacteroides halobius (strain ATCC 35273 / DSM 5150 / MD-1) TaxID=748449 RepID=L0KBD7_HALHC|nr:hypothetical protein [Halobacteroides halobius]AGB41845.1 hypothetical protein Halha_1934 [Halobacteroides halobius DSM 5150]
MEALFNVEMNELSEEELMMVDGGVNWTKVGIGVAMIGETILDDTTGIGVLNDAPTFICGGTLIVDGIRE